jgi:hypothetical protein
MPTLSERIVFGKILPETLAVNMKHINAASRSNMLRKYHQLPENLDKYLS